MKVFSAFTLFLLFGASYSLSLDLVPGVRQDFDTNFTEDQRSALSIVTSEVRKIASSEETGISVAFIELGETNQWFRLYSNLALYGVDVSQSKLVGSWPLARWEHDTHIPEEVAARYEEYGQDINDPDLGFGRFSIGRDSLGCLPTVPLRYGDFTGDGSSEIVVIFADDIVVFSPQKQKSIFSQRIRIGEWFGEDEMEYYRDVYSSDDVPGDIAQYLSRMAVEFQGSGPLNWEAKGYRGYGKIYQGSFSESESQDVLVWHKLYRSRLESDPVRGFELISDNFLHYRMVDGEYLPQPTSGATVRGWLNANNLTWKKGFPNKSECAGEEGNLILEMHDPLLNDPDVLQ